MSKFKIGDRVKYVGATPQLKGKAGTVLCLRDNYCDAGVAFDEYFPFCHSLGGLCSDGHGMWCNSADLELICEHRFNVIITSST